VHLMSEEELAPPAAEPEPTTPPVADKTAGQLLREAREAKGLHVATLAVSLKVPIKKLEALEADRLEDLPDAVFVRALASSVCRSLKIAPAPVLERLPQLNTRVLDANDQGMNIPFRTRADGSVPFAMSAFSRSSVLAVLGLLLAAVVVILLPDFNVRSAGMSSDFNAAGPASGAGVSLGLASNVLSTPVTSTTNTARVAMSVSAMSPAMSAPAGTTASGVAEPAAGLAAKSTVLPLAKTTTLASLSGSPAVSTPLVNSPTLTLAPETTSAAPLPADSIVVFSASGDSWIEVRDVSGKIILQRTLQNGEKVGAGPSMGKLPYNVVVGRSGLTQVTVRGKAFELAPVSSRDSVARFQVK
jgi:cytoskeleton protein RodZ